MDGKASRQCPLCLLRPRSAEDLEPLASLSNLVRNVFWKDGRIKEAYPPTKEAIFSGDLLVVLDSFVAMIVSIQCTVVDCKKGDSSMTPAKTRFNHPKAPGHALGKAGTKARRACTAAKRTSISWLNASPVGKQGFSENSREVDVV